LKPGIQIRADSKFRVQVRRNGTYQSKTFGSIREAETWQRVVEGKATAEEVVDQKTAKRTTLAKVCAWMIEGNHAGHDSHAKNVVSKLRYWQESRFATWSLPAIHDSNGAASSSMKTKRKTESPSARMPNARRRPSSTGSTLCRS
jgi:hypothetical protein